MTTIGGDFFTYFSERVINQQVENDIRIITKNSKKKKKQEEVAKTQRIRDSYEEAMDTSKYDEILRELVK